MLGEPVIDRALVGIGRALRHLEMAAAMLTNARSFPYSGFVVTIYRVDLQQKISTPLVATGVYYWTNVYYFSADNPTEFDHGRDQCAEAQSRAFCSDVSSDRILITIADTGTIVQHGNFHWVPFGFLPASDMPITNCVLVWLYANGRRVGYKRYRVPVPKAAQENGLLTQDFIDNYYTSGPVNVLPGDRICTRSGEIIDNAIVDPRVSMWQLRHGTKRSERRAV